MNSRAQPGSASYRSSSRRMHAKGSGVSRNARTVETLRALIARCSDGGSVSQVPLQVTSELVKRALADAATLLRSSGPVSAMDRVHTALHGYLIAACGQEAIQIPPDPSTTELFKTLKQQHPRLRARGEHDDSVVKVIRAIASIIDAMNPVRNRGSLAHPNEALIGVDEAILCINATRSILQYLDSKLVPLPISSKV
jgi:hypothetical protein